MARVFRYINARRGGLERREVEYSQKSRGQLELQCSGSRAIACQAVAGRRGSIILDSTILVPTLIVNLAAHCANIQSAKPRRREVWATLAAKHHDGPSPISAPLNRHLDAGTSA